MKLITEQEALAKLQMTKAELDMRVAVGSLTAYNTAAGRCFSQAQVEHYAFTRTLLQIPMQTSGTLSYTDDDGTLRRTRRIVWDD